MGVETVFLQHDLMAVFKLSYIRGVLMLLLAQEDLDFFEVAPTTIKKTVTGSGRASKDQVKKMVMTLFSNCKIESYDEADAVAIAYASALLYKSSLMANKDI